MIYNYFILGLFFVMTFIFGVGVGVTIALINIQNVHAQQTNTTVSVPVPINVPVLQYTPAQPQQQQPAQPQNNNNELTAIISSIVVTAIGVISAKIHSDKKTGQVKQEVYNVKDIVKEVVAETLKGKIVDKELARITYEMNPEKANAINNAPAVRLENLEKETEEYAEKAAKI